MMSRKAECPALARTRLIFLLCFFSTERTEFRDFSSSVLPLGEHRGPSCADDDERAMLRLKIRGATSSSCYAPGSSGV